MGEHRKGGQRGGGGGYGTGNRGAHTGKGGAHGAKGGCAVIALTMAGGVLAAVYGLAEAVRALS